MPAQHSDHQVYPVASSRLFTVSCSLAALVWLAIWLWTPPGVYTIDEMIQLGALASMEGGEGLTLSNGMEEFNSPDLRLRLLIDGPNGLAQQYPSGFTALALPFWMALDIRGVVLLNMIAAVLAVVVTYYFVRALADVATARLATALLTWSTFLIDYGAGIWPHAPAALGVVTLCLAAVRSRQSEGRDALKWAAFGGLAIGAALNIRLDVLFVVPAVALWILWFSEKPYGRLAAATVGLLPGLLLAAWFNSVKFGTWNPLTYGQISGGGTSSERYFKLALVLALALAITVVVKHWRSARKWIVLAVAAAILAVILFYPPLQQLVMRSAKGFYVLGFDLRAYRGVGIEAPIIDHGYGVVTFFGLHKKALVQSLPWLFIVVMTFRAPAAREGRALAFSVIGLIMFIYSMNEWHGGKSNNLRYFLGLMPLLAYLGAVAILRFTEQARPDRVPLLIVALLTLAGCEALYRANPLLASFPLQHILPNLVFVMGLVLVLAWFWMHSRWLGALTWVMVAVGISLSTFSAYRLDISQNFFARQASAKLSGQYDALPDRTILHSGSIVAGFRLFARNGVYVALPPRGHEPDWEMLKTALAEGYTLATTDDDLKDEALSRWPYLSLSRMPEDTGDRLVHLLRRP